ncbi:39S ribosomal protein L27, mitochondrial [Protopterus annectens]|uniref:39S ribosomal protein L27, mitochondrial n=1 Tax=Protopterus annectens TaxID=7888 RepID=UPI001CF9D016|nr:39S ribosomal protein L27, mitochondrial [Protopterus annectens]
MMAVCSTFSSEILKRFVPSVVALSSTALSVVPVRCASKKAGGSSRNHGGKSRGKSYGLKKAEGEFVHAGNILATQRLMRWYPGANVGLGHRYTLFAYEDGFVRYTKEVHVPPPHSEEAQKVICKLPVGAVLYKTFINVHPVKQEGRFKLVDMM